MKRLFKVKTTALDDEINRVVTELSEIEPDTEKYDKVSRNLERLMHAKESEASYSKHGIRPEILISAATSTAQILLILFREETHVINSKALGWINKIRF